MHYNRIFILVLFAMAGSLAVIADDNNDKYVSASLHTVILDANGYAYATGDNDCGQIGNGKDGQTEGNSSTVFATFETTFVPVLGGYQWKWIHASSSNTYGIQNDGSLWSWGGNVYHQLGIPSVSIYNNTNVPTKMSSARWRQVKGRIDTPLAIKTDGTLWAWGNNSYGMCGVTLAYDAADNFVEPQQVGTDRWLDATSGYYSSVGVKANGTLWAWGSNRSFIVESNDSTTNYAEPQQVGTDNDWVAVGCGINFAVAQKKDGSLWTWGNNARNDLGIAGVSQNANIRKPTKVLDNVRTFSVGDNHVLAIKNDSTLWGWGGNIHYNLGTKEDADNNKKYFETPQQLSSEKWVAVAAGQYHSVAIKENGGVWAAGFNRVGQIGNSTDGEPVQADPNSDYIEMPFAGLPLAAQGTANSIASLKSAAANDNISIQTDRIVVEGKVNALSIYSASGALLIQKAFQGTSASISTRNLPKGTYILKVSGDNDKAVHFLK